MYMLNMVIILIVMYCNVVTAIDKIPTYLLRFNITFCLHGLLTTWMLDASPFTEEIRTSYLRLCLKMIHNFQTKQDPVVRLTGCCFGALIVSKLVDTLDSGTYVFFS